MLSNGHLTPTASYLPLRRYTNERIYLDQSKSQRGKKWLPPPNNLETSTIKKEHASTHHPLRILVAGAGIGGLTAAVALRQQGHHVEIFERSRLALETGAAIHLAPNCNGLLRRLGLYVEKIGAVECRTIREYEPRTGALKHSLEVGAVGDTLWAHPWHMVHRAHLHTALKNMATGTDAVDKGCILRTSSQVVSVDPAEGTILLEDGTKHHGDVIIGADGVHSATRRAIPGGDLHPFGSGKSAYRFLISTEVLRSDPRTVAYVQKSGCLNMWTAEDRRLVMYPCADNTLMNFVAIHPSYESSDTTTGTGWHESGSKSRMLQVYSGFDSSVLAIFEKVDGAKLSVWELLDMEKIPKFATGKLAMLGDAAHPFLPHQGQGGGQAIEDAVSLAALLPLGTSTAVVPERLQLYETCRYERAHKIQEYTRFTGEDSAQVAPEGKTKILMEYTKYNFGWDEWDHSRQALAMHLAAQGASVITRTPTGFGVSPGPRRPVGQDLASSSIVDVRQITPESFSTYTVRFRSSRTFLEQLLPAKFAFTSPGTLAHVSVVCTTVSGMTWLAGGGHSHVGLYIHGIEYIKVDGTKVHGTYLPVLFENLTDSIVTGRAEIGMPKLFADIDIQQDASREEIVLRLSWRGTRFAELTLCNLAGEKGVSGVTQITVPEVRPGPSPTAPPSEQGLLLHRYVPAVGSPGKADSDYAVLCPYAEPVETIGKLTTKDASVCFDAGDWQSLPTLHHITKVLADMPIYTIEEASLAQGVGVDDFVNARRVE